MSGGYRIYLGMNCVTMLTKKERKTERKDNSGVATDYCFRSEVTTLNGHGQAGRNLSPPRASP